MVQWSKDIASHSRGMGSWAKSTPIPELVYFEDSYKSNPQDKAKLFNDFFYRQFSESSEYDERLQLHGEVVTVYRNLYGRSHRHQTFKKAAL